MPTAQDENTVHLCVPRYRLRTRLKTSGRASRLAHLRVLAHELASYEMAATVVDRVHARPLGYTPLRAEETFYSACTRIRTLPHGLMALSPRH